MKKSKVLLLGDSISMAYRDLVKSMLGAVMEVVFPRENGKFTGYTYRMLYEWSQELGHRDNVRLIYWNNGLWDVVRIYEDEPQTEISQYKEMLRRIVKRLKYLYPNAKIVFATTTPVIESRYDKTTFCRFNRDIEKYNLAAIETINGLGKCTIDDLWNYVKDWPEKAWRDATHFASLECREIASHVCEVISEELAEYITQYKTEKERQEHIRKKCMQTLCDTGCPVVLWGAGKNFLKFADDIGKYFHIVAVSDSDASLWGKSFLGIPCISIDRSVQYAKHVIVMPSSLLFIEQIIDEAEKRGLEYCLLEDILEEICRIQEERLIKTHRMQMCEIVS